MQGTIAGTWSLRPDGSDHIPGIENVDQVPLSAKLQNKFAGERFLIQQISEGLYEEIKFALRTKKKYVDVTYQLGKLNIDHEVLSIVVGVDREFTELSILRMGPARGQRSLEQYQLYGNGFEMRVEIDIEAPLTGRVKMIKYLERLEKVLPHPIIFRSASGSHTWRNTSTHNSAALQSVRLSINSTFERKININDEPSIDLTDSGLASKVPETRRLDKKIIPDEEVTYFTIEVSFNGVSWIVIKRYKEFSRLKKFIEANIVGGKGASTVLPSFPGKSLGRISGKALEKRKISLENYLSGVAGAGGYGIPNVVDGVASFLEVLANPHFLTFLFTDGIV